MPAIDKNQRYRRNTAVCPYYKTSAPKAIRCEWLNGTTLQITFPNGEYRREHEKKYCCSSYALCPLALMQKKV